MLYRTDEECTHSVDTKGFMPHIVPYTYNKPSLIIQHYLPEINTEIVNFICTVNFVKYEQIIENMGFDLKYP